MFSLFLLYLGFLPIGVFGALTMDELPVLRRLVVGVLYPVILIGALAEYLVRPA